LRPPRRRPRAARRTFRPFRRRPERALSLVAKHPPVVKALAGIRADSVRMFEEQVRINEIPAPPFKEQVRAEYYLKKLREAGLKDARIDTEGNVIGVYRGNGRGPRLVVSAHLDTVFPEGTDVKVREKGGRYYAPGIADDASGLATLLTMAEHLTRSEIRTGGDIIIVGTVGEEELGDLRGVKALFRDDREHRRLHLVRRGRFRAHREPRDRKPPLLRRVQGAGRAQLQCLRGRQRHPRDGPRDRENRRPEAAVEPRTTFTVGTVKGGTSVNAIAGDATMAIDIRSNSQDELLKFEARVMAAIREAVLEETCAGAREA
jgi:acetylornithine deacetylase/succinyl-diaminopimelate desuccinylase-like protein